MAEEFNLPKIEEKILKIWETERVFEKTLAAREGGKKFVFYEGPPYANGRPGIHHVLARIYKDIILRYKTMRGYYVPRRAGWDTHGLPVEMAAEKALGLKSKKDIEKYGIKLFNQKAREEVWVYRDEWENMTRRIGYWLDLKNAYVTYEPEYTETIWRTIAQIAKRKLLYKGHKVVPWCTRCGTALSSHELAQGYKETTDQSVYLKFRLLRGQKIGKWFTADEDTYVLSWTTTPWTLPGNVALAVGPDIDYAVLKKMADGKMERWILAKDILEKQGNVFGPAADAREIFKGKELAGLCYEPLFDLSRIYAEPTRNYAEKFYRIYTADFVATGEGTGVVHTAVMYGEDDYRLGLAAGLPQKHTVDEEGKFTKNVPGLAGMYVKGKETDEKIFAHLKENGNLLKVVPYTHEYPYCWRCGTPVLYYARMSWFIAMSRLREKLLSANRKINWIPEYVKEGRFGEWLREVKDWNLSRERYWGTPLPIWECKKCGRVEVIGCLEELGAKSGGARNSYFTFRHGESEANVKSVIDSGQKQFHLTQKGRIQAGAAAKKFAREMGKAGKRIDLIFSSDLLRAKETARIAAALLGVKKIALDKRLEEIHLGGLSGCHDSRYHKLYPSLKSRFERHPEGGESLRDVRRRVYGFFMELEKKYRGKNILIVSHEYPIWMMNHVALGWSEKRAVTEKEKRGEGAFVGLAEFGALDFKKLPRNDGGEIDLHRPYADEIFLKCAGCGARTARIKEVADVWYDSGAMPFAQEHRLFAQNKKQKTKNRKPPKDYPADYIAEGMDQTRGWFYTLLAVATAMGFDAPYKNVVSLGLINDKHGQKMSKSKGNIVDPWAVMGKYGADAVRWYFYTASPPGEAKNFDEADVLKSYRRMHLLLWNSVVFYKTYARQAVSAKTVKPENILDRWILARLGDTSALATRNLDKYDVRGAALKLERFIDDLSRWYIRRSRRRFSAAAKSLRGQNFKDNEAASATLRLVLRETAKLAAPFTPFFAEYLNSELGAKESVHLADWPGKANAGAKDAKKEKELLAVMAEARRLASLALAKRAEAGIKVRQPLPTLKVKSQKSKVKLNKEFLEILADEVNVKEAVFDKNLKGEIELDTTVTPELKEEGMLRELSRIVQGLRQEARLKPKDKIVLLLELPAEARLVLAKNEKLFKRGVGAAGIEYRKSEKFDAESTGKLDGKKIWLGLRKTG